MAATLVRPEVFVWPYVLSPQPATVPSSLNARLWARPPARPKAFVNVGTFTWPRLLVPQPATLPGTNAPICQVALVLPAALLTVTEYAPAVGKSAAKV